MLQQLSQAIQAQSITLTHDLKIKIKYPQLSLLYDPQYPNRVELYDPHNLLHNSPDSFGVSFLSIPNALKLLSQLAQP
jgi:hypothetical protein